MEYSLTYSIGIPVVSAFIGWVTNYIAVKMLFRPRKPFSLLGYKIQGLVPKRQKELALSIGETVERDLLSLSDIVHALQSPTSVTAVVAAFDKEIDPLLQRLVETYPMLGAFIQGGVRDQVKGVFLTHLTNRAPQMISTLSNGLSGEISIKDIVREKMEEADLSKLESIIYRVSSQELRAIEILGGVLGFLIGVGQVVILYAG
jgi:uncharacterized membrane protein YheB (UPF0754 family)